ncbi:hypothetical protein SASPL_133616 [Salvia splendens]|uniref:Uncharacterized protein n=1 Tax=Salvia splendens TaxID=180675 RepID=A0A8X8X1N0_SALSN|nr:hypothetical protein SASPL_133616 [Salvia splendens]
MQLLNEISSWELLRNRIFGDKPCPSELEPLGRTVAACCSGLPLAIVVISGLLDVDQKTCCLGESCSRCAKILRRVSVTHSDQDFLYGSAIHTVICLCDRKQGKECSFDKCRLLRILDLIDAQEYFYKSDSSCNSLPDHLFELFHLRYLALDYPFSIPAAISKL